MENETLQYITILFSLIIIAMSILLILQRKKLSFSEENFQKLSKDFSLNEQNLNHIQNLLIEKKYIIENLQTQLETARENQILEKQRIIELETKLELLQKQIKEEEVKLQTNFKLLANEILDNNTKKLTEQNKLNLGTLLNPVQNQLNEFKKKVEDVYEKEAKDRTFLSAELKTLKELNLKISNDAINLTNALKGQKKQQGIWGEMVLEKVLENSGLRLGAEYQRETYLKDNNNVGFRPDVIVNLPDNRHIIIDAKTSLNSYNEYVSCEDENKEIHLKKHILAIKEHIKSLGDKKYENLEGINSLDFIFMFIPIEGALLLALENDVNLYDNAFKQKIILVSPTTLLVALRAVENTWRYERQAQSITKIADRAEKLYEKFAGFIDDMQDVNKMLQKANDTHQKAFDKLSQGRGNLINQVQDLKKISNIKPKKQIDNRLLENSMESTNELS
jgi:DNA recombination protein RmuC